MIYLTENYDIIIIGSGPGGYSAAIQSGKLGKKTAVIECGLIGGTCLNNGCIPTKSLLHCSKLYRNMQNCGIFGLSANNVSCDYDKVFKYAGSVKDSLRNGMEQTLRRCGVDIIRGKAFINSDKTVAVSSDDELIGSFSAENIIVATGSHAAVPNIPGTNRNNIFTADELLSCGKFGFGSISIIGGGVIGIEFATIFSEFGMDVSVIEATQNILPGTDIDISRNAAALLKKHGVKLFTNRKAANIVSVDNSLCLVTDNGDEINSDAILVAIGRLPNTDSLFSDSLNLKLSGSKIQVDCNFQTSVPGIYAIGDIICSYPQLAHAASAHGISCVRRICGLDGNIDLSIIPSCIYTHPEIACVGITADEARKKNIPIYVKKAISSSNGKSIITNSARGFVKLVFNAETDEIIGAHLMCENASDMIGEFSSAIVNKLKAAQISIAIRPHPTYNEMIFDALADC